MTNLAQLLELSPSILDKNNSFVGLGGHSLLAVKLSNACKSAGIDLSLTNILLSESITVMCATATSFEPYTPVSPCSPAMRRRSVQFSKLDAFALPHVPLSPGARRPSLAPVSPTTVRRPSTDIYARRPSVDVQVRRQSVEQQFLHPSTARRVSVEYPMSSDAENAITSTMTDLQLSFIHSYKKSPGTNIINFRETYHVGDVPAVKAAWKTVIEGESIFRQSFDLEATESPRRQSKSTSFHWNDIICASEKHFRHEMESHKAPANIECSFDCVTFPESDTSTYSRVTYTHVQRCFELFWVILSSEKNLNVAQKTLKHRAPASSLFSSSTRPPPQTYSHDPLFSEYSTDCFTMFRHHHLEGSPCLHRRYVGSANVRKDAEGIGRRANFVWNALLGCSPSSQSSPVGKS